MKEWLKISCLLCVFGFVREIRPSEPYVTEYLLGPWRNITEQQVSFALNQLRIVYTAKMFLIHSLLKMFIRWAPIRIWFNWFLYFL